MSMSKRMNTDTDIIQGVEDITRPHSLLHRLRIKTTLGPVEVDETELGRFTVRHWHHSNRSLVEEYVLVELGNYNPQELLQCVRDRVLGAAAEGRV